MPYLILTRSQFARFKMSRLHSSWLSWLMHSGQMHCSCSLWARLQPTDHFNCLCIHVVEDGWHHQAECSNHFLTSAIHRGTRSTWMNMAPRYIVSNTNRWFSSSQCCVVIPLQEWQCHYTWRLTTNVVYQNPLNGTFIYLLKWPCTCCAWCEFTEEWECQKFHKNI